MRKIIIDNKKLKYLYSQKLLSSREIAKIYKCDQGVILRRLRKYYIPIRPSKKEIKITKSELTKLYINEKQSAYKIAKLYNCDPKTIYKKLRISEIPIRPLKRIIIAKKDLKNLYFNRKLSLATIGRLYSCNQVAVFKKMRRYGFFLRTPWEINEKHLKNNFSGNLMEKAYLLEFRAGDLGVRKTSRITGKIHIGCSSTKPAQIKLIKNLFRNYGPIWISKPNKKGVRSIDTLLNSSFSFLLPKKDKISNWILKNKEYFAAYTAGYTDAEGSIGVYDNRAKFRIGSYDIGILRGLTNVFIKQRIKTLLKLEREKGHINKRGYILKGNFWRITINEKKSLISIFKFIGPYLKHSDRIKAMKKAISNIKKRS